MLRRLNEDIENRVSARTSELQKTNEELRSTQDALVRSERAAAVGQIVACITHEIKNPLNHLSVNIQIIMKKLAEKFGDDSFAYNSAAMIRYEVNRINNILEEFVNYSKFPGPRFFENDINKVIMGAAVFIGKGAKGSDVEIEFDFQEELPVFMFDAMQFKDVFVNLSMNAINAMPYGGILSFSTGLFEDNAVIRIVDTGEGIRTAELEKIFDPFYSTKDHGLGLGLPIVKKIIEGHNGKIKCESIAGTGTVFEITLPLEREHRTSENVCTDR